MHRSFIAFHSMLSHNSLSVAAYTFESCGISSFVAWPTIVFSHMTVAYWRRVKTQTLHVDKKCSFYSGKSREFVGKKTKKRVANINNEAAWKKNERIVFHVFVNDTREQLTNKKKWNKIVATLANRSSI